MVRLPEGGDRDFTATAAVVSGSEVLLIKHTKAGHWVFPGGHVEEDELLHETARRETREETGYSIEIVEDEETGEIGRNSVNLPIPMNVNFHRIREGHWHCDFTYSAIPVENGEASHADEHDGLKWFDREELRSSDYDIPENIRKTGLEAIDEVRDG
ncbi:MAG: NUDIX domain-containing protein [Candidatus Nanohaloarchaea archaeon]|nr:NUDIX domain-containing protein [Candidatus Nanohaloarchaea archaeon]